ncbi:MAG: phytanoyl-CoA dioxygenase family protein [Proteobacteria bacterium]|nr:phytanoyl-CoA dioxygenase family protein [Pseudomonadota bacterium]
MPLSPDIASDGFAIIPDMIAPSEVAGLINIVDNAGFFRSKRGEAVFGGRNILATLDIASLANEPRLFDLVESIIGPNARAVRGLFFDKTPSANWPVAWHQDLTLAVAERVEIEGWTAWSLKAGVHHVQPPSDILERMATLRIQLDDSDADNGPLRVLPGTHRMGRIKATQLTALRAEISEQACIAPIGSVLAFKPLLLHASSAAKSPRHRRVIHLEYAPAGLLPPELSWASA